LHPKFLSFFTIAGKAEPQDPIAKGQKFSSNEFGKPKGVSLQSLMVNFSCW